MKSGGLKTVPVAPHLVFPVLADGAVAPLVAHALDKAGAEEKKEVEQ